MHSALAFIVIGTEASDCRHLQQYKQVRQMEAHLLDVIIYDFEAVCDSKETMLAYRGSIIIMYLCVYHIITGLVYVIAC